MAFIPKYSKIRQKNRQLKQTTVLVEKVELGILEHGVDDFGDGTTLCDVIGSVASIETLHKTGDINNATFVVNCSINAPININGATRMHQNVSL